MSIPKHISGGCGVTPKTYNFMATLAQPHGTVPAGCDAQQKLAGDDCESCRYYAGADGLLQSAEEIFGDLPNALQGYSLAGGFNQRRVHASVNIVRDPRLLRDASDKQLAAQTAFATSDRGMDRDSSCLGGHADGMNRGDADLRGCLDEDPERLPKSVHGVYGCIKDQPLGDRVKRLCAPSTITGPQMEEEERRKFLNTMAPIKSAMIAGADKNVQVEPVIGTLEYVQKNYKYPQERSN